MFVDRAGHLRPDQPVNVDEELRRQREDPVLAEDVPRTVEADRVAELVSVGVRLDVGRRRLLDADPDDRQTAIPILGGETAQDRRLLLARRAPGREEVEPDDLAAEGLERDGLAVEVRELVGTAVAEIDAELRCLLARLESLGRCLADDERGRQRIDKIGRVRGVAERRRDRHADDRHDEDGERSDQQLSAAERADEPMAGTSMRECRALGVGRHALRSPSGTGNSAAGAGAGRAPSRRRWPTRAARR